MHPPAAPFPRPLDQAEAFFWLLDRHSSMNFSVIAEGHGPLPSAAVAAALPKLQQRHPLLAVAIVHDPAQHLCFEAAPEAAVSFHTSQSNDADWRDELARATVEPFALGSAPLFRAHHYTLPEQRWVLALTFHHSIADARSAFAVLSEALQLASGAISHLPAIPPRPPLLALYPEHWQNEAGQAAANMLKTIKRDEHKALGLPATLPGYEEHPSVQGPSFVSLHYPAELLKLLGQRAKAESATLHGVIGAAQLLALRQQMEGAGEKVLGLTSPADLRPTLAAPVDTATPGFYVTLLSPAFRVDRIEDFWALAREISARNRQHFERGDGHLLYHFFPPARSFGIDAEGQQAFDEMMGRGTQTSLLSNVGRLPAIEGLTEITVEHLSFSLCPAPKQPIFTSATTYQSRLTLNLSYDRQRLPEPLLRQIAHSLDHLLHWAAEE